MTTVQADGPDLSISRRELRRQWSSCGRKHGYDSFEEATEAIEWNEFVQPLPGSPAVPYDWSVLRQHPRRARVGDLAAKASQALRSATASICSGGQSSP